MSHEFVDHPSQAVQDEATKIIAKLDGVQNSQYNIDRPDYDTQRALQAREMLIKDSQTMSAKDMQALITTVMNGEDKKRGYDLEIYGHSSDEKATNQTKLDQERMTLIENSQHDTAAERAAAFQKLNADQTLEKANFDKELVLVLTHHSGPGEYGEKGRTPGATIEVEAYKRVNGLPDFNVEETKK